MCSSPRCLWNESVAEQGQECRDKVEECYGDFFLLKIRDQISFKIPFSTGHKQWTLCEDCETNPLTCCFNTREKNGTVADNSTTEATPTTTEEALANATVSICC